MNFPSRLIEDAVNEFAQLPGIGRRTALRLVLHLLKEENDTVEKFGTTIVKMRNEIKFCRQCHNISDNDLCLICEHPKRDGSTICVVEDLRDVIAIENTNQYNGLYHVLGGIISPIDGIGPDDLNVETLLKRAANEEVNEIIMALSPTIEGDTTVFYLSKKIFQLTRPEIKISTIARGIAFGGELEYTDELTLARSIATRIPYENYLVSND